MAEVHGGGSAGVVGAMRLAAAETQQPQQRRPYLIALEAAVSSNSVERILDAIDKAVPEETLGSKSLNDRRSSVFDFLISEFSRVIEKKDNEVVSRAIVKLVSDERAAQDFVISAFCALLHKYNPTTAPKRLETATGALKAIRETKRGNEPFHTSLRAAVYSYHVESIVKDLIGPNDARYPKLAEFVTELGGSQGVWILASFIEKNCAVLESVTGLGRIGHYDIETAAIALHTASTKLPRDADTPSREGHDVFEALRAAFENLTTTISPGRSFESNRALWGALEPNLAHAGMGWFARQRIKSLITGGNDKSTDSFVRDAIALMKPNSRRNATLVTALAQVPRLKITPRPAVIAQGTRPAAQRA